MPHPLKWRCNCRTEQGGWTAGDAQHVPARHGAKQLGQLPMDCCTRDRGGNHPAGGEAQIVSHAYGYTETSGAAPFSSPPPPPPSGIPCSSSASGRRPQGRAPGRGVPGSAQAAAGGTWCGGAGKGSGAALLDEPLPAWVRARGGCGLSPFLFLPLSPSAAPGSPWRRRRIPCSYGGAAARPGRSAGPAAHRGVLERHRGGELAYSVGRRGRRERRALAGQREAGCVCPSGTAGRAAASQRCPEGRHLRDLSRAARSGAAEGLSVLGDPQVPPGRRPGQRCSCTDWSRAGPCRPHRSVAMSSSVKLQHTFTFYYLKEREQIPTRNTYCSAQKTGRSAFKKRKCFTTWS